MSRNQNLLISSIVSLAVLISIGSTYSRVEAKQSSLPLEPNKEYIAHFNHNHHWDHHRDRHPWRIDNHRQQMAREWERIRWQRYQRCIHNSQFVNRWYCDRILQEPNPFRIPRYVRYGIGF